MFDLRKLKIIKGPQRDAERYSFVGIRKNKSGELEFWLPLGFEEFPDSDFLAIKQVFFRMYKTFNKFEENQQVIKDKRPLDRDQITVKSDGYRFENKYGEPVVLYSKIHMIESVLGRFNDLIIRSVVTKLSRSNKIDYSKIDKYLHRAIYLPNDVIYIDEMYLPENQLQLTVTDLLGIFCFIYLELKEQLEEPDKIDNEIKHIASKFRQTYLTNQHSLFDEHSFDETLAILKDVLNAIDKHTYYKDHDYWLLFGAVENFLYGELEFAPDGTAWGISNFSSVWEDMCSTYLFYEDKGKERIFFADSNIFIESKRVGNHRIDNRPVYIKPGFDYPFCIKLRDETRYLRPDLLLIRTPASLIEEEMNSWFYFQKETIMSSRWSLTVQPNTPQAKKLLKKVIKKMRGSMRQGIGIFFNLSEIDIENIKNVLRNKIRQKKGKAHLKNKSTLVDFKYHSTNDFTSDELSKKTQKDIIKQLLYECALQGVSNEYATESQFWIPFFFDNIEVIKISLELLNLRIKSASISVFKVNFIKVQSVYLECQ